MTCPASFGPYHGNFIFLKTRININIYIIVHTCFYVVLKPEYTNYWICLEW
jgi:hypothetical protein